MPKEHKQLANYSISRLSLVSA